MAINKYVQNFFLNEHNIYLFMQNEVSLIYDIADFFNGSLIIMMFYIFGREDFIKRQSSRSKHKNSRNKHSKKKSVSDQSVEPKSLRVTQEITGNFDFDFDEQQEYEHQYNLKIGKEKTTNKKGNGIRQSSNTDSTYASSVNKANQIQSALMLAGSKASKYNKIERISLYKDMDVYFGITEGLDEDDNSSLFEADIDGLPEDGGQQDYGDYQ
eukprot:403373967